MKIQNRLTTAVVFLCFLMALAAVPVSAGISPNTTCDMKNLPDRFCGMGFEIICWRR